ncbi:IS110 family RNA-guided transposase [Pseudomonas schmalbachii]|uniref:IS110 family transposase n=1 Tax=Pseudomonas schmalbachii TaxID=2816993 RepID=A0ABS3TU55_9PSED|nr:IS110 family transposase [Pseudomonas schmalbachii]MBO3277201.1 IS110 family transposase [Pseudomonas schmalbachii]
MTVIGIDVSKQKLDCLWLRDPESLKIKTKVFANQPSGFAALIDWCCAQTGETAGQLRVFLEATGVYHEALAYYLHDRGVQVFVLNPAHVRDYARSLGVRGKTDKQDSLVLARYGSSHQVRRWQPERREIRELKAMIARYEALQEDLQREANRREKAEITGSSISVLASIDTMLSALRQEAERLRQDIDDHIDRHDGLKRDRELLQSIQGIGEVLSRHLLAMLHSRDFASARQCAAFAGLVPRPWESGSSVKGRAHLTKTGQPRLRAKLYMGAIVAKRYNPTVRALYQRLLARGKAKKSALGAAMRKLLQIAYGVLKTQTHYQPQPT